MDSASLERWQIPLNGDALAIPTNANYWGYSFLVSEQSLSTQMVFKALMLKTAAATQALADAFLSADPLDFVRHSLLDQYVNGATPTYWPNLAPGWTVI